ncbi:hypothetical protein NL676_022436 [Syzygium grande]|nr:hypothetical protein NL676_022436 [Syzygium grande]
MAQKLTNDIIIEILLRLPVKSLVRFKCVSKQLHLQRLLTGDVIPSQRIIKSSLLQTVDYEVLNSDRNCDAGGDLAVVKSHDLGGDNPGKEPGIVGSCDGLVCLSVFGRFILYNPTTKESINVPDNLVPGNEVFHSFGYDSALEDYKIVKGVWQPRILDGFSISTEGLPTGQYYVVPLACTEKGKIAFQIDVWEMILFNPEDGTFNNYPLRRTATSSRPSIWKLLFRPISITSNEGCNDRL